MFIVWGSAGYQKDYGDTVIQRVCSRCGNNVVMRAQEYGRKFTLFWIPLFKTSSSHFFACPICSAGVEVSKDIFTQNLASNAPPVLPPVEAGQPQNLIEELNQPQNHTEE